MRKNRPHPTYFTDEAGCRLVRLPVSGSDTPAITQAALYDKAKRRHGLTGSLYLSHDGKGHSYVMASIPNSGTHKALARLLLDCPRGYHVRYIDGDSLNLLPENFRLASKWADPDMCAEVLARLSDTARAEEVVDEAA